MNEPAGKRAVKEALSLVKWLLIAAATGLVCGLAGGLFHFSVDKATEWFGEVPQLLYLLPAAGLLIALLYRACRLPVSIGTDRVFESTRSDEGVPPLMAPLIFVSSFLTHLFGGSSGREGAALQLGAGIAGMGGRLLKLNRDETHVIELCGMSALFSALFGTPVAAAFFAVEVVDVGLIHYRALFPCVLSAVAAYLTAGFMGVEPTRFVLPEEAFTASAWPLFKVIVLSSLCGLLAILFCKAMHFSGKTLKRLIPNDYARIFAGGAAVVLITLLLGTRDYNGAGMGVIRRALNGDAKPEAWILKLILTCVTLGAGYKGGEIVPSLFVGSTFGALAGGLLGLNPAFSAAAGMIAVFCGVTNTPAASILMAVEMFSGAYFLPLALSACVSFLISGRCSLYHSQRFLESKYAWKSSADE